MTATFEDLDRRLTALEAKVPNTKLLSKNIVVRSFAVWAHYLLASVFIIVPIVAIVFVLGFLTAILQVVTQR